MTTTRDAPSITTAAPSRPRRAQAWRSRTLVGVGLFAAGVLIAGFSLRREIVPLDEGLALQAARRIAQGQVPYRDFTTAYGPVQPYLLALLFKLFGTSLMQWRVLRILADAGTALVAYLLVAPRAPRPLALASWLTVLCALSSPMVPDSYQFALLPILLALLLCTQARLSLRRLFLVALLVAIAAAFRIDFGIYGLLAVAAALAFRGRAREVAVLGGVTAGLTVLVYLPFAILAGPASIYQNLVGRSLATGAYWTLPFPLSFHAPSGAGLFNAGRALAEGLSFYTPLLLVVGLALCVLAALIRWRRGVRPASLTAGLLILAGGALAYLVSRPDGAHAQPLYVVLGISLALAAADFPGLFPGACATILALVLANGVISRISALLRPPRESAIHVAVSDGVEAPPREARAIERMVALVDAEVSPGRPIYVLPRRSDLIAQAAPLVYVLTQRSNPTRVDFGLLTGAAAQAHIVGVLERIRPRVVVRWTDPLSSEREPNLRGRSSGVHTVDDWVSVHYRVLGHLFHYDVLILR